MKSDWNVDPSIEKCDPLVFDHIRAYKVRGRRVGEHEMPSRTGAVTGTGGTLVLSVKGQPGKLGV
jgi:hypothetical protein